MEPANKILTKKTAKQKHKSVAVPTRIVHPLTGEARILMDHHDRLRFVLGLIKRWGFPSRKESFSSEQSKTVRQLAKELFSGTQEPEIIVASDFQLIVATAGAVVTPAIQFRWGLAIDQGSWAQVFDEVKVLIGEFEVYPIASAMTSLMVFCIDYDDAAVLASSSAALAYDTREVFNFISGGTVVHALPQSRAVLPIKPQGIPDKQWIDTSDTTTVVAYLKGYGTGSASASVFNSYFLMKVKFRQVN
jgi:hypothetical protein